jgi:hypothetical protein
MTRDLSDRAPTSPPPFYVEGAWLVAGVLSVYIVGYRVLRFTGYFDLATLPWGSDGKTLVHVLYWPLEWFRHL